MTNNKALTGSPISVFFSYTIPLVFGLVATSSAGIIDGMFIGNYIGEDALAAVTLCMPIFPVLLGIVILFSTGGEVFCGKYIGENNFEKASQVFSKVFAVTMLISITLSIFGLIFLNPIIDLLGAGKDVNQLVSDYLQIIIIGAPIIATFSLSYFVRVDGNPKLSALSLITTSILNVFLDYLFIVYLDWGIVGAAWGTVLSYLAIPLLLLPHFLLKKGNLHFVKLSTSNKVLRAIAFNGSSEFLSEVSGGVLLFIINITMMKYYGTQGVAAYAIVGYLLYFTTMTCYGVSDSLKSIVSVNFGAKKQKRMIHFLKISLVTVTTFGLVLVVLTQINSVSFVSLFLNVNAEMSVSTLANKFLLEISPVLFLLGINIILSAYFTAIHNPVPSLVISLARTFFFPIIFIPVFSNFMGGSGVITALITSEFSTLLLAIIMWYKQKSTHHSFQ